MEHGNTSLPIGTTICMDRNCTLLPKHKVFLSHSGAQKDFVEQLCVDLERCDRHPFLDKCRDCLPIGKDFPSLIFEAIEQCEVGVVVLSEEFFASKWPMLELVAMANLKKKKKPNFTIMPIFLGITFLQCRDVDNHKRWLSMWHVWAKSDNRIVVQDWENALGLFGPTNGLKYTLELGEVKFREEIVEAVCKLVPPQTRFEDSRVQGRSRLCKVIHKAIKESTMSLLYGVHIVGLYGVGGIGKTTICKAMCNELSEEYRDKVCHVELGNRSEQEVFKEVLRKLSNKNLQHLETMDVDQYRDHLMRDIMDVKVFLTIDNVSSVTSKQAWTLLQAKYGLGSVILVTARSLSELTSLQIDASDCMEMPELELEEARSLFLHHVACVPPSYLSNKDDFNLISSCIERCHFKKGDGNSYHYHPLALQVLGEQLRCVGYVPSRWLLLLHKIDFLNPFGEIQHPVFSILRISFDALNPQDQLLFMDVALFAPENTSATYVVKNMAIKWTYFEWLGMVHGIPGSDVMERLENLKRKSLLENIGNAFGRVGMHDLWREFARLETKAGMIENRRWIFEWDEYNVLGESTLPWSGHFVNLRRMFFLDKGFMKLKDVDFACFPNVTVLKLCTSFASRYNSDFASRYNLDLRGLNNLKSLELESSSLISVVGLDSLRNLKFLRWLNMPSNLSCINEINSLTNLQVLILDGCGRAPNVSKLVALQMAYFCNSELIETIEGLSSMHTNLQCLDLSYCTTLQSCWGVGELVALEELRLNGCYKLKKVPNLQKLKQLQKLDVTWCKLLRALPGFGDLVTLLELKANGCECLEKLPDMHKLKNLKILDLSYCKLIKSLPGLDELVCLQTLEMGGCKNLTKLPNIHKLTNLQILKLYPKTPLQSFEGWSNLILLERLEFGIEDLHVGPDLSKFIKLKHLYISRWQSHEFSSLMKLVLLETLTLDMCKGVRGLPDLKKLSRLQNLEICRCEFEDWSSLYNLPNLEDLKITHCNKLEALPNLQELVRLHYVEVKDCAMLRDLCGILKLPNLYSLDVGGNPCLSSIWGSKLHQLTNLGHLHLSNGAFTNLQRLASCPELKYFNCSGCPIEELPDLANFPKLQFLDLHNCVNLTNLTCSIPLGPNFESLNISGCKSLKTLPNLTKSWNGKFLIMDNSGVVLSAELIKDMKARWPSIRLFTNKTSFGMQSQGNSQGVWHRTIGMITSLRCRCTRTSLEDTHLS